MKKLITTFTEFPVDEIIIENKINILAEKQHDLMPWDERRSINSKIESNMEFYLNLLLTIETTNQEGGLKWKS